METLGLILIDLSLGGIIFFLLQRITGSIIGSFLFSVGIIGFLTILFNLSLESAIPEPVIFTTIPVIIIFAPIPFLITGAILMHHFQKRKKGNCYI